MRISLIVAVGQDDVIGRDNELPWHIPEDLKRFKALTMHHPVIMGRKTFESIGRPLSGRTNIVITRQSGYRPQVSDATSPFYTAASAERAIELAGISETNEVFVAGGAQIYGLFLRRADRIYLTRIHHRFEGDAVFPSLDESWREASIEHRPEAKPYPLTFVILERSG
jgi:dihydrofolate reductase